MQLAIEQSVGELSLEEFSDWLAGQKAIASNTGFLFGIRRSMKVYAYYRYFGDPKDILPSLKRGQDYVWLEEVESSSS